MLRGLERFLLSPEIYRSHWLDLTGGKGLLWFAFAEAVLASDELFFEEIQKLVDGTDLSNAILSFYQFTDSQFVDCDRLRRNFDALAATARLAASIRRGADEQQLLTFGQAASTCLFPDGGRFVQVPPENELEKIASESPAAPAEKLFRQLARKGNYSLGARSWTLFWMKCHDDIEGSSSGEIPVVSTLQTGPAHFARLSLVLLDDYSPSGNIGSELVEHPRTALIPFDHRLLDGLKRAWRGAGSPAVRWQLRGAYGPQRDDSFSGGAAVAFRHLTTGQQPSGQCLILARIGGDGQTLEHVENEDRKIEAANAEPGIRQIIVSSQFQDEAEGGHRQGEHLAPPSGTETLPVRKAATAEEAVQFTSVVSDSPEARIAYLDRYYPLELLRRVGSDYYYSTTFKKPEDGDEVTGLLRIRPYQGERPADEWRLIWDLDLRTLYRISSSPATESSLIQLHDAGVDRTNKAFVAVFLSSAGGYETLNTAINSRQNLSWLNNAALKDTTRRSAIWTALKRLGAGIATLHSQNVIHGNISASSVYLHNADESLETWRLAGFELSSYLLAQRPMNVSDNRRGVIRDNDRSDNWGVPPECAGATPEPYTFEHDWYGLGMIAVRLFFPLTFKANAVPYVINREALRALNQPSAVLDREERELITSLIDHQRENRLKDSGQIFRRLDLVISRLAANDSATQNRTGLCVVVRLNDVELRDALRRNGYDVPTEPEWNYKDGQHKGQLREAVKQALRGATIHAERGGKYSASKSGLILRLRPYRVEKYNDKPDTWNFAFIGGVEPIINPVVPASTSSLDGEDITVLFNDEARHHDGGRSWLQILPLHKKPTELPTPLNEFHSFLSLMNECELLLRAAEIFPCRIEDRTEIESSEYEQLRIFPEPDNRGLPKWCLPSGGLIKFLFEKQLNLGPEATAPLKVYLTPDDGFNVAGEYRNSTWEVETVGSESQLYVDVARERDSCQATRPGSPAFLRLTDHWGQIELVKRRKRAIENLPQHIFLLKAMVKPSEVVMEPDIKELPYELDVNKDKVDLGKIAVLKDILGARPIYALQGPPGTGKTTLVAQLLRQILKEDPVVQALVTSQSHAAVNVLMERVFSNDFFGEHRPIMVRLGHDPTEIGAPEAESRRIVQEALTKLDDLARGSALEEDWYKVIRDLAQSTPSSDSPLFVLRMEHLGRLLKRSANITFCTTSDWELEDLADQKLSYDWCIVEEAGRAHGFDLALPMQAGHRWMLLGDQAQLTPYRHTFFSDCVKYIEDTLKALESLTNSGSGLVDRTNIARIGRRLEDDPQAIRNDADRFLKTFERMHEILVKAQGKDDLGNYRVTEGDKSVGANAGRLTRNYRMHPAIGDLISETFYEEQYSVKIENDTEDVDGSPKKSILHPFSHPAAFAGRPIVWVDVPWRATRSGENLPGGDEERNYDSETEADTVISLLGELLKNPSPGSFPTGTGGSVEVDSQDLEDRIRPISLAILSPYIRQRDLIAKRLDESELSLDNGWLQFRKSLRGRRRNRPPSSHTVDSFQGNEAGVVILSLVRNNSTPPDGQLQALGFVRSKERLNVMLSRAEQLLVLVGSWEFFARQLSTVDRNSPTAGEMRRLFESLEDLFNTGRAAFVDCVNFEQTQPTWTLKGKA